MRRCWFQGLGQMTARARQGLSTPSRSGGRRWCRWACWSLPLVVTVAWVVAAWWTSGPGVALPEVASAGVVGAAIGGGRLLMRRTTNPPSSPSPGGSVLGPSGAGARSLGAVPPPADVRPVPRRPLPPLSTLPSLSTWQLCWAWRRSYVHLRSCASPDGLAQLTTLRRGYLDELQRRDPAAFARWLPTARAASDPARFFCRGHAERRPVHVGSHARQGMRTPSGG